MASETIRDVVIRVAIQQTEAKLNVAPVIAAQKEIVKTQEQATKQVQGFHRQQEKSYYDLQTSEYKIRRESNIQQIAMHERMHIYARQLRETEIKEVSQVMQAEQAQRRRFVAAHMADSDRAARAQMVNNRRLAASVGELAEGFGRLSRGLLLASAGTDLEKIFSILLKFQIGFDIIAGGVKTIKAGTQAWLAYTASAQGAAMASRMAAIASNPITLALAAVAGAYVLTTKALRDYTRGLQEANAASNELIYRQNMGEFKNANAGGFRGAIELGPDGLPLNNRVKLDDQFMRHAREAEGVQDAAFRRRLDGAGRRFGLRDSQRGLMGGGAEADRAKEIIELQNAMKNRLEGGDRGALGQEKEAVLAERMAVLRKQSVDVTKTQGDRLREILQVQQEIVKAAEQALKTEQERVRSADASFGRLSKMDQAEAQRLAKKKQSGAELTDAELSRLEGFGIGDKFTEGERAKRGRAAGSQGVLGAFGDGSNVDELKRKIQDARGTGLGGGLEDIADAIVENTQKEVQAIEKLTAALAEASRQRQEAIDAAAAEAAAAAANRKAGAAAGGAGFAMNFGGGG